MTGMAGLTWMNRVTGMTWIWRVTGMTGMTMMAEITRMGEVIRVTEMVRMTGMFYLFGHLAVLVDVVILTGFVFLVIFNSEKNQRSRFCRVIVIYKGRNFPRGEGGRFKGSLVGAVLLKPFDSDPV